MRTCFRSDAKATLTHRDHDVGAGTIFAAGARLFFPSQSIPSGHRAAELYIANPVVDLLVKGSVHPAKHFNSSDAQQRQHFSVLIGRQQ